MIQKVKDYANVAVNIIEVVDNRKIAFLILCLAGLIGYLLYVNYQKDLHIAFLNTSYQDKLKDEMIIHKKDLKDCNESILMHIKEAEKWKERVYEIKQKDIAR